MTVLPFEQLQVISGLQRPSAVRRWLRHERISYISDGRGHPITTDEAITKRLESKKKESTDAPDFDPKVLFPDRPAHRRA